ncbi:MAG: S41 family peptidase, partial [Planctomycetaceae bacterium]
VSEIPQNKELQTAVGMLKGKPGVEVTIGVVHLNSMDIERIKIVREIIQLQTVLGDRVQEDGSWNYLLNGESKIAYIRLSHFSRRTGEELRTALRTLKEQGMQGLVLDLRFNPGGLLTAAVEVTDMFVEEGKIVSTEGRNSPGRTWSAKRFGTYSGFPMAVLVNRFSASASEIVSAALQDHQRAVVVGERTWGKGSVQNVIEIGEGESALKLTTASYHRPSGKNIHRFPDSKEEDEWGVMPDDGYEVKFTNEQLLGLTRSQRAREVVSTANAEEAQFEDAQLSKALEYVQAQLKPAEAPPEKSEDQPPAEPKAKDAAATGPPRVPLAPSAAA